MRRRGEHSTGVVFGTAVGLALVLTTALVGLLAPPGWADGALYRPALGLLRGWTAFTWGIVIVAGLRWVWRR